MSDAAGPTAQDAAPTGRRADLRKLWDFMRQVSGDDAYERYLARHAITHPEIAALTRREFFAEEQARKWGSINRCC